MPTNLFDGKNIFLIKQLCLFIISSQKNRISDKWVFEVYTNMVFILWKHHILDE